MRLSTICTRYSTQMNVELHSSRINMRVHHHCWRVLATDYVSTNMNQMANLLAIEVDPVYRAKVEGILSQFNFWSTIDGSP